MRNKQWLRFSLASLTLVGAALGAGLVACGDDDNGATPTKDGGSDSTTGTDSATTDAAKDQQTPPKKTAAKLQIANAATDMGPDDPTGFLRFCYEIAPTVFAPLPPIPDVKASAQFPYPGVPIGTGGAAEGTGADLSGFAITPYLMNAHTLAERGIVRGDAGAGPSCGDLFAATADAGGKGPLVNGVDYWKLATIPVGTLANEKSFVLVLTGCPSNSTIEAAKCGPDFTPTGTPGNGNLKTTVYELDRATSIAADKIGAQFIHASPSGALILGAAGGAIPGFYGPDAGGTFKPVMADGGAVALNTVAPLNQIQGVDVNADTFTANPNVAALAIPLPQIQLLTYGGNVPDGGNYRNGAAFTFIALGDPTADADAGGTFNTKKFHYIALPNDPGAATYK